MWPRPLHDPTSWRYQAAIHGYNADNPKLQALAKAGDREPANAVDVWNQCQHNSWYFLPWHRGYLGCFEEICREAIRSLDGPADDWALPYWDYSAEDADAILVRPEFLSDNWPGSGPNPLFNGVQRAPFRAVPVQIGSESAAAGDFGLDQFEVSLAALTQDDFSAPPRVASFGGGKTGFSHSGDAPGKLEGTPHGDVHMAIGLAQGERLWMGSFQTAGLDPIFWLHHCNLDRLWSLWLRRGASKGNPADPDWESPRSAISGERMPFLLSRTGGTPYTFVPKDLVRTETSVFAYRYDNDPAFHLKSMLDGVLETEKRAMTDRKDPELVGGTDRPLFLEGKQASASVALVPSPRVKLFDAVTRARRVRTFLSLENIVVPDNPVPYRVFLSASGTSAKGAEPQQLVGTMPLFGAVEASHNDEREAGSGLSYTFDVTEALAGVPDGAELRVSFVPKEETDSPGLRVGKISFYRG
jgi:tyrosinase